MSDEKVAWYDREDWDTYELTTEEQKEMDDKRQEELALVPPPLFEDGCGHGKDKYLGRVLHPYYLNNNWCDLYLISEESKSTYTDMSKGSLCIRKGDDLADYSSLPDMRGLVMMTSASQVLQQRASRVLILCFRKLGMKFLYEDRDLPCWMIWEDKSERATHQTDRSCSDGWYDINLVGFDRTFKEITHE